ncbi:MAG: iron-siderophore ABC transporter substrate-binding protein [Acidimicrobiia bacterium]
MTIDHKYGSTEITDLPERIVTVGLTDHDVFLALGVVPVGVTEWFGDYPSATWPWAQAELGDAQPVVVGDAIELDFERIAALEPDVIVGSYSGLTQDVYSTLSAIAPTVAQPAEYVDYGVPWEEVTLRAAQVVGGVDRAESMIADIHRRFARIRQEHPELVGATAVAATPYEGIYVFGPQDARGRLLSDLGFELPPELAEIAGDEFGGNLSPERADLLDVDVVVWLDADDAEGPLGGPLYSQLPVHTEGREVFLDSYDHPLGGATSFVSILSLPYLLDGLVPMLEAAVDGDPTTEVPAP